MARTFNVALASPHMLGDRPISVQARVAALDLVLEEFTTPLSDAEADMVIDYAAARFEKGEIEGALSTLRSMLGVDLTGAYRIAAVLHTEAEVPPTKLPS